MLLNDINNTRLTVEKSSIETPKDYVQVVFRRQILDDTGENVISTNLFGMYLTNEQLQKLKDYL